jgi:hypothetical protein
MDRDAGQKKQPLNGQGCGTEETTPKWASGSFKMPNAIEVSHALRVALLWRRIQGLFRLSRASGGRTCLVRSLGSTTFTIGSEDLSGIEIQVDRDASEKQSS